jgi:hypothetical protein
MLIVGKENHGPQLEYATLAGLERAIERAGAKAATVDADRREVRVTWRAGEEPEVYAIDAGGRVDAQLAWDMDPRRAP